MPTVVSDTFYTNIRFSDITSNFIVIYIFDAFVGHKSHSTVLNKKY